MSNEAYVPTNTSRATNLNARRSPTRTIICVDMDEVIADTLREQILRYNDEFNENLTVNDLKDGGFGTSFRQTGFPPWRDILHRKTFTQACL
jgi:5' nucleotidase, deoxy (Pyrimidine), cytosolic type C protein (NT5C)